MLPWMICDPCWFSSVMACEMADVRMIALFTCTGPSTVWPWGMVNDDIFPY